VESRLLRPGDTVRVPPGQSVPADGTVLEGESDVDESMLTGEPMPVAKGPGDPVTGGSLNGSGSLRVRVERVGADTFLASVQRLVDAAQSSKAPIQNLADRVAAVFVPVIVAVSLGTLAFWLLQGSGTEHAMLAAVSVLVIACPCALGLATPTALIVGMGRGSQLGMLVRDGSALQAASAVRAVLFDKTGTLTEGRPKIVAFHALGGWSEDEALAAVAAAEAQSEHPLAAALVEEAVRRGLVLPPATGFQSERGLGASAMVQGSEVRVGRRAFVGGLAESGEAGAAAEKLHAQGATVFYAAGARGGAVVAVSDLPAHGARETVAELRRMGMRVAMLTGDGELAARSIARDVGIEEVRAGLLPADKVGAVEEFRRAGPVAMVGDGVNDAPALAAADVGVAMGSGTAAAIESAGVTLLRPDLRLVPAALRLSRATMATIRWNLAWAFGYNVAMVPVAMTGKLSPMLAAAAMAFSSLSVVLNSLRLKRARV
jgi:Cu+-exporting ATPase